MFKPVLAIDSALGGCAVAVVDGEKACARTLETEREQAAKLMPMVQDAMDAAGVAFADLGLIVTTTGPGSFTGLRIGLSAARALGLALNVPVQGVTTFDAMVQSCAPRRPSLVVLESKRADFYVQAFDALGRAEGSAECLLAADMPRDRVVCGDGVSRLRLETGFAFEDAIERFLIDPIILARAGLQAFMHNGATAEKPQPLYMRGADVSVSGKSRRQINDYPEQ